MGPADIIILLVVLLALGMVARTFFKKGSCCGCGESSHCHGGSSCSCHSAKKVVKDMESKFSK